MRLVLGWRLALICTSIVIVLLLEAMGLGDMFLGLYLDRSEENSHLLQSRVE
jgi:hypothetical protein